MLATIVRNWFQNQRSRDRKLVKQELPDTDEQLPEQAEDKVDELVAKSRQLETE